MRTCTLHISNMRFGCIASLRFDDIPDNGPDDSILSIMAINESQAIAGLQSAINGRVIQGPLPLPMTSVFDQEGLDSLTSEQFVQATRIDAPIER